MLFAKGIVALSHRRRRLRFHEMQNQRCKFALRGKIRASNRIKATPNVQKPAYAFQVYYSSIVLADRRGFYGKIHTDSRLIQ
ncbi:hypothetical protein TSMEX_004529 [Taenia solium]|eukprot:TsM_000823700 transcript=TsM_000823700 gene=TsM_000823700